MADHKLEVNDSEDGKAKAGTRCWCDRRRAAKPRWGRVVVFASFMTFLLEMGSVQTHGVYMTILLEEFQVGSGELGWAASSALAVLCLAGPFGSVIVKRLGCRRAIMLGGAMMAAGTILASFATNSIHLFLCLGLIVGLGGSLIQVGLVFIIGQYYNRHHSIANGLAFSGIGAGVFIFSPLVQFLIDTYGWRGSFIIEGAIVSHVVVMGALLRPASRYKYQRSKDVNPRRKTEVENVPGREGDSEEYDRPNGVRSGVEMTSGHGEDGQTCGMVFLRCCNLGLCELLRKSPSLLTLYLSCFLLEVGCSAVIIHITNYAILSGLDLHQASGLLSFFGIGGMVGRLTHGWLLKVKVITPYRMFIAALLVSTLSVTLTTVANSFGWKVFFITCFGITSGALFPLVPVILREFVSISHLPLAFGLSLFCNGAGTLLGGYLIGAVRDALGDYKVAFHLITVFFVVAAVVLLLQPMITWYKRRRTIRGHTRLGIGVETATLSSACLKKTSLGDHNHPLN